MNTFLTIVIIISLAIASINIFQLKDTVLNVFQKGSEVNIQTTTEPEASFSERIQRGNSYLKQAFVELARNEYLAAVKQEPNNPIAYVKLAETLTLLKNYQGAIQNLGYAQEIQDTPAIHTAIAKNMIYINDYTDAAKVLEPIKDASEEAAYYYNILAILQEENINSQRNIPHADSFEKATRLQKAFEDFRILQGGQKIFLKALIAEALIDNEDFQLAKTLLENILAERSDYRDSWIMLGYTSLQLEDYQKAREAYQNAYDLDPTKAETQFFLAIALEEMGKKNEALEFYQLAYKNHYEPKVHVIQKIAELSLDFGYYDEAFRLYNELLKLKHESVDDFIRPIWIALTQLSDIQKAEDMADIALKSYPQEAQSYNLLAWVSIEKESYDQAQEYLNQSFALDPDFAAAHYNQGLLYERSGNEVDAILSYEKAYQLDKDGPIGNIAAEAYNRLLQN